MLPSSKLLTGASLIFLSSVAVLAAFTDLNGTWIGTFNGRPQTLLPDGSYPETVTRFKLTLRSSGARFSGTFSNLDESPIKSQPIKNGKRVGANVCFDVFDSGEDHRWCVRAKSRDLDGVWNLGPEGGPGTGGLGTGARLFSIRAKKAAPDK